MDWVQAADLSAKPSFIDKALDELASQFTFPLIELWFVDADSDARLVAAAPSAPKADRPSPAVIADGALAENLRLLARQVQAAPAQSSQQGLDQTRFCRFADSPIPGFARYLAEGLDSCLLLPLRGDPEANAVLALWMSPAYRLAPGEADRLLTAAAALNRAIAVACKLARESKSEPPGEVISKSSSDVFEPRIHANGSTHFNTVLNQAAARLSNTRSIDAYLDHIVCALAGALSADSCALFIYDAPRGTLAPKAGYFRGVVSPYLDGAHPITPENPLRQPILQAIPPNFASKVETFLVPEDELVLSPEVCNWHRHHGHRSIVTATVQVGATAMGFLAAAFTHRHPLDSDATQLLLALANQASVAIRLAAIASAAEQQAVAEERLRLAREIHDSLSQSFVGILMHLAARRESARPHCTEETWSILERIARHGLMEARRSVATLRLSEEDTLPFTARLAALSDRFRRETPLNVLFTSHGEPFPIPASVAFELLRIAEESLNNVVRHSQSPSACVSLEYGIAGELSVTIADCGVGFDVRRGLERHTFGLLGMRERAERIRANLSITSQPSLGSRVAVRLRTAQL